MKKIDQQTIAQLRKEMKAKNIEIKEVASTTIAEWFTIVSEANNTTPMMLLAAVIPSVAVLMGKTVIQTSSNMTQEVQGFTIPLSFCMFKITY